MGDLLKEAIDIDSVVVRFAGDSGDGMQTVGEQFTDTSAILGNDISTYPDFPAEIRAPQGTLPGVSGFQIQIGNSEILTPGDAPDALVAMNPAALKVNLSDLSEKGLLVLNTAAFSPENLRKAGYTENPLDLGELDKKYQVIRIDMTTMTRDALVNSTLTAAQKSQCKNFFALGFIYWVYNRSLDYSLRWMDKKWAKRPDVVEANTKVLKAGYYFGETTESLISNFKVSRAPVEPGIYRKISGNEALALGLVTAADLAKRDLVYGSYPITPASSLLEGLARFKNFGVKTVQAEDELCAIGIAIGASFAGQLGVTGTSGPGLCLKSEFLGLAVMMELPLIVANIQRGGPSTGLPTKTEQADLLQAIYGRNGESPVVVLAASSPADCFETAIEAVRITFQYNVPVILLSDGFIASGSEPWKVPSPKNFPEIEVRSARPNEEYVIYKRDPETLARTLAAPGTPGLEHRIGGLEKNESGGVSYDALNHERMVGLRAKKVVRVADSFPKSKINGTIQGKLLVVGWGGTYGSITTAVNQLRQEGKDISSLHLRYLNPLPKDLKSIVENYEKIVIAELNGGQLHFLLQGKFGCPFLSYTKIQGRPFTVTELKSNFNKILGEITKS